MRLQVTEVQEALNTEKWLPKSLKSYAPLPHQGRNEIQKEKKNESLYSHKVIADSNAKKVKSTDFLYLLLSSLTALINPAFSHFNPNNFFFLIR